MKQFWDHSWENLDMERLLKYISYFDTEPDKNMEAFRSWGVKTICDAGCGCGIYARKLAAYGFQVAGFDISPRAVEIAGNILKEAGYHAELKVFCIQKTEYTDEQYDGVICRDVIDHMGKKDGDFLFTEGKWEGMIFHPYNQEDIMELIPDGAISNIEFGEEIRIELAKPAWQLVMLAFN